LTNQSINYLIGGREGRCRYVLDQKAGVVFINIIIIDEVVMRGGQR
jgi:hypothetical protein